MKVCSLQSLEEIPVLCSHSFPYSGPFPGIVEWLKLALYAHLFPGIFVWLCLHCMPTYFRPIGVQFKVKFILEKGTINRLSLLNCLNKLSFYFILFIKRCVQCTFNKMAILLSEYPTVSVFKKNNYCINYH